MRGKRESLAVFLAAALLFPISVFAGSSLSFSPSDFSSLQNTEIDFQNKHTLINRWSLATNSIEARYYTALTYDAARKKSLLFGGLNSNGENLGDTWVLDAVSGNWSQISPSTAPAARFGHAMVWVGDKTLLFGGFDNETWMFNMAASSWSRVNASSSPPAGLLTPAMAYDSVNNKVVLFGGGSGGVTWIYDVAASSWSFHSLNPAPSERLGAMMTFDASIGSVILYGGRSANNLTYYDDTWRFNTAALQWTQLNPSSAPLARAEGFLVYDSVNNQSVLYGGRSGSADNTALADIHFFHYGKNRWVELLSTNNDSPSARYGHAAAYDGLNQQLLVMAGKLFESTAVNSLWLHVWRSTGSATSNSKNVSGFVPIVWSTITVSFAERPVGTDVLFQIGSSSDGVSFDSFRGPDGLTSSFYSSSQTLLTLWHGHTNRRHLKIRSDFLSTDPPYRARLNSYQFAYNQAPSSPTLTSPSSNGRVNSLRPPFSWQTVSDPDGSQDDPVLYHFQIDTTPVFTSADISQENIAGSGGSASLTPSSDLQEGLWYWRVRGKDKEGFYGSWSSSFSVTIDTTTPPSAVSQFSAVRGAGNGEIVLNWTFPGDDKGAVTGGLYRVRFSTQGAILNEAAWLGASASERTGLLTATSGQALTTTLNALETNTSYYFAIKTQDETGNISTISLVSPFAMTNASPTVTLLSHTGGQIFTGATVISWSHSDPNSGDSPPLAVHLSSNSGASFGILIASAIPSTTTAFAWDSRSVPNSTQYRLRVSAADSRGLSGSSQSSSDFRADNVNESPVIQFSSTPASSGKIQGNFYIAWNYSDPNTFQTVVFDILLSSTSGSAYLPVTENVTLSSVTMDTLSFFAFWGFRDAGTYRVKIVARDSGSPSLSASVETPLFSAITHPVESFALTKPVDGDEPTVFDLSFHWNAPVGFGSGITYELRCATEPLFARATVYSNLTALALTPPAGNFLTEATYYWQVKARNSLNGEISSAVEKFKFSPGSAKSGDRKVQVQVLSGLPAGAYISIRDANLSYAEALSRATLNSRSNRLIQLVSEPVWHIELRDLSGNTVDSASALSRVTFRYTDRNGDGLLDTGAVPAEQIKVAKLNEAEGRWEVISAVQSVDRSTKTVTTTSQGFSIFTVLASAPLSSKLSLITNFPNPFSAGRESTRIRYVLTENAQISIRIYTLMGDLVRIFEFEPGSSSGIGSSLGYTNEVLWDGKNGDGITVANGMYIARIRAKFSSGLEESQIRRIGVVK